MYVLWSTHQRRPLRHQFKPVEFFISQVATTLGGQDPSAALNLSQGELLRTKTMFWVDILQLARTVSQKPG